MVYRIHQHHHDVPNDLTIVTAGPLFGLPIGVIWYSLAALVIGPDRAAPLMSGVAFGYLFYEWVHYEAHGGTHKAGWMGYLKRYHLTHHHIAQNECFGVTSPLWDKVFRTEFKAARKPRSSRSTPHSVAR
jgi:sterol desaturase/sphingolipid hydroxylase (fatty acid hydroxylase superfamily)